MTTDRKEEEEKKIESDPEGIQKARERSENSFGTEGRKSPRKSEKVMGTLKKNERKFWNVERGKDVGGNYKRRVQQWGSNS